MARVLDFLKIVLIAVVCSQMAVPGAYIPKVQAHDGLIQDARTKVSEEEERAIQASTQLADTIKSKYKRHPLDTFGFLLQTAYKLRNVPLIRWEDLNFSINPKPLKLEVKFRNTKLIDYFLDIDNFYFYKGYLVFKEKNSYDSNAKQIQLSFIDFRAFERNLGRSEIPIFRLPSQAI